MDIRKELHPRNRHKKAYDFESLIAVYHPLEKFVERNEFGTLSIDFFNPYAVKALNKALLIKFYGITYWNIPKNALCPPLPGRADYIHYVAMLEDANGKPFAKKKCHCLDLGVGANCIYPIIGVKEYDWTFVGADINEESLKNAHKIITCNPSLVHKIELRQQMDQNNKFVGMIRNTDFFDLVICNPPFHNSEDQATRNATLKLENLKGETIKEPVRNFGGVSNELWCRGGELGFISDMINESVMFAKNVIWFTSLVSKEKNIMPIISKLKKTGVRDYEILEMAQGTKVSRIVAWRF